MNWQIVRLVRRVYATGEVTMEALATLLGVGESTIRDAIKGVTWREDEHSE